MLRDSGQRTARYHVFILSLWAESSGFEDQRASWRFSLEQGQTTGRKGFKNLDELMAYLEAWVQNPPGDSFSALPIYHSGNKELLMPMSINRSAQTAMVLLPGAEESVGALGVGITYKTVGSQSDGQWLALEYIAPPQFAGPPPHWHKVTTEIFYVLAGALTLRVGDQTIQAGPGGYAYVPPGTVHAFSNQTDAPAKYLLVASPAGLENYFAELAELVSNEPSWPPKDMSPVIALMAKYDTFMPPVS